jgi:hypothetical protein
MWWRCRQREGELVCSLVEKLEKLITKNYVGPLSPMPHVVKLRHSGHSGPAWGVLSIIANSPCSFEYVNFWRLVAQCVQLPSVMFRLEVSS